MVAVCAAVKRRRRTARARTCAIGLTNMGRRPLRASAAEQALRGEPLDAEHIAAAAEQAAEGTDPPADLNASADYKRHLARVLCRRALEEAVARGRREHSRTRVDDDVERALAGEGYLADRGLATAVFLAADARAAAAARGRGGRRQDGGRARAGAARRRAPDPAAVPRGHRPPPRRLRLGLPAPAAGDPRGRGGRAGARAVRARVPAAPAAARGARGRGPGGPADRRGRPRRRRVRGVPARVPRRLRDHDPGARDGHARRAGRSSC